MLPPEPQGSLWSLSVSLKSALERSVCACLPQTPAGLPEPAVRIHIHNLNIGMWAVCFTTVSLFLVVNEWRTGKLMGVDRFRGVNEHSPHIQLP